MSTLTNVEKRRLERLLNMGDGYVLDFSNRTFKEFILDVVEKNIYDEKYDMILASLPQITCIGQWQIFTPVALIVKMMRWE